MPTEAPVKKFSVIVKVFDNDDQLIVMPYLLSTINTADEAFLLACVKETTKTIREEGLWYKVSHGIDKVLVHLPPSKIGRVEIHPTSETSIINLIRWDGKMQVFEAFS